MGHHESDDAAVLEVKIDAAGKEQAGHILVGGIAPPGPDAIAVPAQVHQPVPQDIGGLVIVDPGRIADDHVHLGAGQRHGPYHVAGVVGQM